MKAPSRAAWVTLLGGGLLLALLSAAGLTRAGHGLDLFLEARVGGTYIPVKRMFEPRPVHLHPHRLQAILLQHWNFDAHGVPTSAVPYRVTLSGTIEVPPGQTWDLRLRPNARTRREVGPESEGLTSGAHPLVLTLNATLLQNADLVLEFRDADSPRESWRTVPIDSLRPETPPALWRSPALPWLVSLGVLLILLSVLLWPTEAAIRRRRWPLLALSLCVFFGLGLRLYDYDVMPEFHENPDELFATWNGYQLLTDGTTQGWSLWANAYGDRVAIEQVQYFESQPFQVIRPYLEHPPLLHLLVGAAAKLGGAKHYLHARLRHTRLVPIALFVPTLLLLVWVGRRIFPGSPTPYFAALLYSALPNVVLQQRVIKEEALLTPMMLLGLYAFLRWDDEGRHKERYIWCAGIVTGLGALAKVPGAFFLPPLVLLFFLRGGLRPALLACAAGVVGLLPLALYGAYVDWSLFVFSTGTQAAGRPAHWNLFPRFFADGLINHNLVGHGQTLFAWLAYAVALGKLDDHRRALLSLTPLVYLSALALSSGNWTFGWYILPVMPFLCLGAGHFLTDLLERPTFFGGLVFFGLLVMYGFNFMHDLRWAMQPAGWAALRRVITPFMLVALVPYLVAQSLPNTATRRLAQATTALGLMLFLVNSAYFATHYDDLYVSHHDFDRMLHFDR